MKMRIFYKICAVILKVFGVFIPYCFGYYTALGQTTTFYANSSVKLLPFTKTNGVSWL